MYVALPCPQYRVFCKENSITMKRLSQRSMKPKATVIVQTFGQVVDKCFGNAFNLNEIDESTGIAIARE